MNHHPYQSRSGAPYLFDSLASHIEGEVIDIEIATDRQVSPAVGAAPAARAARRASPAGAAAPARRTRGCPPAHANTQYTRHYISYPTSRLTPDFICVLMSFLT